MLSFFWSWSWFHFLDIGSREKRPCAVLFPFITRVYDQAVVRYACNRRSKIRGCLDFFFLFLFQNDTFHVHSFPLHFVLWSIPRTILGVRIIMYVLYSFVYIYTYIMYIVCVCVLAVCVVDTFASIFRVFMVFRWWSSIRYFPW